MGFSLRVLRENKVTIVCELICLAVHNWCVSLMRCAESDDDQLKTEQQMFVVCG